MRKALTGLAIAAVIWFIYEGLIAVFTIDDDVRRNDLWISSEAKKLELFTKELKPGLRSVLKGPVLVERFPPEYVRDKKLRCFTDDDGFLVSSSPSSMAENEGNVRIIFTGGSTTECMLVDEENRFPWLVGKMLREKYKLSLKVMNHGVRGNTSQDSLNLLINKYRYFSPDYLVIMHNVNDRNWLWKNLSYRYSPPRKTVAQGVKDVMEWLRERSNIVFYVGNKLYAAGLMDIRWSADHRPSREVEFWVRARHESMTQNEAAELMTGEFRKNLKMLVADARILGIEPVLVTSPSGNPMPAHDIFNDVIRKTAAEKDVLLIDLAARFPLREEGCFSKDGVHFTDKGSIIAAQIISEEMAGFMRERSGSGKAAAQNPAAM